MKQKQQLISIIIVTWNGKHWLDRCLPSIKKQTYTNYEIIVVDNGSTDGTVAWIKKKYPEVILVELNANHGFAEGNNQGYKKAKGQYIYFLNNDTELSATVLEELFALLNKKSMVAGVQSKILLMEDRKRLDTIGAFLTPTGFLYHNAFSHLDSPKYDKEIALYTLKGASMMFRRSVLEEVIIDGYLFDPDYFAYFEETDLCHRIWLAGYSLCYAPKAVVWHHMGATSSSIDSNFVQFHSFKNRIMTYIKLFEFKTLVWLLMSHLFFCEVFAMLLLARGKFSFWASVQRAVLWNIVYISKTLDKRRRIFTTQKKKTDNTLLPLFLVRPPIEYYISWVQGKPYMKDLN